MAKIVQNAEQVWGRNGVGTYTHPVHQVLLGKSNNEMETFRPFSEVSYNFLNRFKARHLSNLAYAHALLGFDPIFETGGTLFDKIGGKAVRQVDKLEAEGMVNTVWAFVEMKKRIMIFSSHLGMSFQKSINFSSNSSLSIWPTQSGHLQLSALISYAFQEDWR